MKYDIHDNGGRPFRVVIDSSVSIYKNIEEKFKLLKTVIPLQVFIGKSTGKADSSDHTPEQSRFFLGNSILLHLSDKRYMYIGSEIYEFNIEDEVEYYFSMIGRNDVAYPIIVGTKNVYFMLDHTYLPRNLFPKFTKIQWENAYSYYYGSLNLKTGERYPHEQVIKGKHSLEKYSTKMKVKMIHKRF